MRIFEITWKRLLREQLEIRLQNKTGIQKELQKNIKTCASELGIDVPKAPVGLTQGAPKGGRRVRCTFCAGKDRKTNSYSSKCVKPTCKEHQGAPT